MGRERAVGQPEVDHRGNVGIGARRGPGEVGRVPVPVSPEPPQARKQRREPADRGQEVSGEVISPGLLIQVAGQAAAAGGQAGHGRERVGGRDDRAGVHEHRRGAGRQAEARAGPVEAGQRGARRPGVRRAGERFPRQHVPVQIEPGGRCVHLVEVVAGQHRAGAARQAQHRWHGHPEGLQVVSEGVLGGQLRGGPDEHVVAFDENLRAAAVHQGRRGHRPGTAPPDRRLAGGPRVPGQHRAHLRVGERRPVGLDEVPAHAVREGHVGASPGGKPPRNPPSAIPGGMPPRNPPSAIPGGKPPRNPPSAIPGGRPPGAPRWPTARFLRHRAGAPLAQGAPPPEPPAGHLRPAARGTGCLGGIGVSPAGPGSVIASRSLSRLLAERCAVGALAGGGGEAADGQGDHGGDHERADRRGHPHLGREPDRLGHVRPRRRPPGDVTGVDELVGDEPGGPRQQHQPAGGSPRRQVPPAPGEDEEVHDEHGGHRHEHRAEQDQEVLVVADVEEQRPRGGRRGDGDGQHPAVPERAQVLS